MHTCGGNNDCASQGGCAFTSSTSTSGLLPPQEQWIPGENSCKGLGGCQTPISAEQVFDTSTGPNSATATFESATGPAWTQAEKNRLLALVGTNVWQRARTLLGQRKSLSPLPTPVTSGAYDGTARRAAIAATSK